MNGTVWWLMIALPGGFGTTTIPEPFERAADCRSSGVRVQRLALPHAVTWKCIDQRRIIFPRRGR